MRNKTPKRKVKAKLREGRSEPMRRNDVWAIAARQAIAKQMPRGDFVHDPLYDGRKIRILTVIDAFTCFVPAIDARPRYTGSDVVDTLEQARQKLGYPKSIRVDNGPEFISKDLDLWAYTKGVVLDVSRLGKPTDNAYIESLNGKFRAECLNVYWFMNFADARRKCEAWREDYNNCRPHRRVGYKVPTDMMISLGQHSPP